MLMRRSGSAYVDDALQAVIRTPSVFVRLLATTIRFLLLVIELAIGVLSIPLLVPVLVLRLSARLCTLLDRLLDVDRAVAETRTRPVSPVDTQDDRVANGWNNQERQPAEAPWRGAPRDLR